MPGDGAGKQFSFSVRELLLTVVIIFALAVVYVVLRILLHALLFRSGGGGRRRGGLAAGFMRSINRTSSSRRGLDASALSDLPVTAYRKEAAGDGAAEADCAVCLSELAEGDKVRELPNCGHAFHVECADAWLRSRTTCPLCRAEAELPQVNGKAKAEAESSSAAAAAVATEPLPQPALFGSGGTLIVTVHGVSDSRQDVRGSTSG